MSARQPTKRGTKRNTPDRAAKAGKRGPWSASAIETWPLERLRPFEGNAKVHPPDQVSRIAAAIKRYGFTDPIHVKPDGEIIGGHARALAAREAGLKAVPVIVIEHLSDEDARALRLAHNRVAELGKWDLHALEDEVLKLGELGVGVDALGWTEEEMARLLDTSSLTLDGATLGPVDAGGRSMPGAGRVDVVDATSGQGAEPEDAPAPRWQGLLKGRAAVVTHGQLWQVGGHRLLIADACDPAAVALLMDGQPVETVVTDPPYCSGGNQEASRAAGTWGTIAADNLSSQGYTALMRDWLAACRPNTAYVFTDWRQWQRLGDELEVKGLPVRAMIVWNKCTPAHGAMWRAQHELIAYASRAGLKRLKGQDSGGNVIDCGRSGNRNHYTEKPVELLVRLIAGDSKAGRTGPVLDPFAGSGSTLIAAHRSGRLGRGLEIEPRFAQIALMRLQDELAAPAELVGPGVVVKGVTLESELRRQENEARS